MNIEIIENPSKSTISLIYDGLREFNIPHFVELNELEFGVFVHNHERQIVGGAIGTIIVSAIHIKYLWLPKNLRGQGIGAKIMSTLEASARDRGIESITLDTYSFQAPEFYKKLGFIEVGKFENYPCFGMSKLFFQKKLNK